MANKKKEVYKVKPLTEGKKNIITALLEEYDIEIAEDIQDALKEKFVQFIPGYRRWEEVSDDARWE